MYQRLLGEVSDLRQGNRRRIRKGLWALVGVTVGLLALVFISQSSKVIFLLLWIVSMFGIAAYLIAVEYVDYEMQNKVKKITQKEVELDQLMALPTGMPQLLPHLRGRSQESEAVPAEPTPEEPTPEEPAPEEPAPEEPAPEEPAPEVPAPEEPCPAPVPPCPQPVPPRPASVPVQPEPLHPELALTLSDLQESSRQLAQGFEQMSRELGRISRYMGDQDRRSREVQA